MKKLFSTLLLAALLPSAVAWAQDETVPASTLKQYEQVVLRLHDGTVYELPIDTASVINSYYDNVQRQYVVDVHTAGDIWQFGRSEIATMKFLEYIVSIDKVKMDDDHTKPVVLRDGHLEFSPAAIGDRVRIYDVAGHQVRSFRLDSSSLTFDLHDLPQGIYVVRVKQTTLKIMNL